MISVRIIGLALLCAPFIASAQSAPRCSTVTVTGAETSALGWVAAITALRDSLGHPGHAWGCVAALVTVEPVGSVVSVVVSMPDGRHATRRVLRPEDLSATVEAVLIAGDVPDLPLLPQRHHRAAQAALHPVFVESTVVPPPAPAGPDGADVVLPLEAPSPRTPRFLAGVDGGLRITGPSPAMMFSAGLHAGVSLGHPNVVGWVRYDGVMAGFDASSGDLDVGVLSGGVTATWSWPLGQGQIEAGPSFLVADVMQSYQSSRTQRTDSDLQPRIGGVVRWRSRAQGVGMMVAIDADGAPGRAGRAVVEEFPTPPAWSLGLSAGLTLGGLP